jgi:hypothetical protein
MDSDKFSDLDALPFGHDEKIVGFGERTQAPAEAKNKIVEAVGLTRNLSCHALNNGKNIFRPVRKLPHDEMDMLVVPLSNCEVLHSMPSLGLKR